VPSTLLHIERGIRTHKAREPARQATPHTSKVEQAPTTLGGMRDGQLQGATTCSSLEWGEAVPAVGKCSPSGLLVRDGWMAVGRKYHFCPPSKWYLGTVPRTEVINLTLGSL
jgi:hypothetical protein